MTRIKKHNFETFFVYNVFDFMIFRLKNLGGNIKMDKMKRVVAWMAIIILGAMYIATLFIAIFAPGDVMRYVTASIYATIVVGVAGWGLIMLAKRLENQEMKEFERSAKFASAMQKEKKRLLEEKAASEGVDNDEENENNSENVTEIKEDITSDEGSTD